MGLTNETTDKLSEVTSDLTEWLSSIPYVGFVMDCDEDENLSGDIKSKDELSDDFSVKPTPKQLRLSLSKGKTTKNKLLDEAATGSKGKTTNTAATGHLEDCTNSLNRSHFIDPVPPDLLNHQDTDLLCRWLC